jgi:thiol-disulfide isomerase/thioredoxin
VTHKQKEHPRGDPSKVRLLVIGVVALLLLAVVAAGAGLIVPGASRADDNAPSAPDFSVTTLDGETVGLSDFQGKTVLVNFWATWCPPCRAEMPALDAYYQAHRDEGFVLLAVNAGESRVAAEDFTASIGFSSPVALDTTGEAIDAFGVIGLPTSILIDSEGIIRLEWQGMLTGRLLEEKVTPWLPGRNP